MREERAGNGAVGSNADGHTACSGESRVRAIIGASGASRSKSPGRRRRGSPRQLMSLMPRLKPRPTRHLAYIAACRSKLAVRRNHRSSSKDAALKAPSYLRARRRLPAGRQATLRRRRGRDESKDGAPTAITYDQRSEVMESGGSTRSKVLGPSVHCTGCSRLLSLFVNTRTRLPSVFSAAT